MAGTMSAERGGMDIKDQRSTFQGFLKVSEWAVVLIAMAVALLTAAFAMGLGWWAGVGAFAGVGVGAGMILRMGGAWWATLAGLILVLSIGGLLVSLL